MPLKIFSENTSQEKTDFRLQLLDIFYLNVSFTNEIKYVVNHVLELQIKSRNLFNFSLVILWIILKH